MWKEAAQPTSGGVSASWQYPLLTEVFPVSDPAMFPQCLESEWRRQTVWTRRGDTTHGKESWSSQVGQKGRAWQNAAFP